MARVPSSIGTREFPLGLRAFGPWDVIEILDVVFLLESQPRYNRELKKDKKSGGGQDYENVTGKGYKSSDIGLTLSLWIDSNGFDWLQVYADIVPRIQAKEIAKRYAVPCYTPGLTNIFGINSIIVTSCGAPQYKGRQMWTADLTALDARTATAGNGKSATKKMVKADQLGAKTIVNREVVNSPAGGPNQSGPAAAQQLQSRVNTPATRSTTP